MYGGGYALVFNFECGTLEVSQTFLSSDILLCKE